MTTVHSVQRAKNCIRQYKRKQLLNRSGCLYGVYEENNLRSRLNQLSQSSLFKQERRGDSQRVIANRLACQQALCNRRKRQGGSRRVPSRTYFVYCLAQRQRCKLVFSATITLPHLTRINLCTEPYQSLLKLL